ncbi:hypothetical protein YC2023_106425 [Brassica napus]
MAWRAVLEPSPVRQGEQSKLIQFGTISISTLRVLPKGQEIRIFFWLFPHKI